MSPRHATGALLAALMTVGTVAAGVSPASAAGDSWRVPDRAQVVIKGHGFGHGHGMSQYGAEGAARQGLTYRQIADFYYPGTTWGRAKGKVRVLLTGDTTDDLVVLARPDLRVQDGGTTTSLPDNGADRWRIVVGPGGGNVVGYLKKGSWHRWRVLDGPGAFVAHQEPITLVTPGGTRDYRGRLAAVPVSAGSRVRNTVNVVRIEDYLRGVVPLEMPALWTPAAVRAQAVAARTYAAYERAHPASTYDLCDTWSCQVYGGVAAEHPASDAAVEATAGRVLLSGGEPAFTQFGSSSGGWTSAGSVPYLPAQEDPYDDWSGNPVHSWKVAVGTATLEQRYPAVGNLERITVTRRDGNGDWGGRVATLLLSGSRGKVTLSGDTFRAALGLRSTYLTFRVR